MGRKKAPPHFFLSFVRTTMTIRLTRPVDATCIQSWGDLLHAVTRCHDRSDDSNWAQIQILAGAGAGQ